MWSFSRPASSSSFSAVTVSPQVLHSTTLIEIPLDVVAQELALDAVDLRQAPLVAVLARELGGQIGADDVSREGRADHACAEAQDIAVVVLDGLVGRVGVVGDDAADMRELAGRHGHARAGAADEHGAVVGAVAHRVGRQAGGVRIVDRVGRPGPEILDLVAGALDGLEDHRLEREPRVIERAGDLHEASPDSNVFSRDSSAYSWAAIRAAP